MERKIVLYYGGASKSEAHRVMHQLAAEIGDAIGYAHCYYPNRAYITENGDMEYEVAYYSITTENVLIQIICKSDIPRIVGLKYDEIFNTNDPDILTRLNIPNKPRFEGSILDYVEQIEKEMAQHTGDKKQ